MTERNAQPDQNEPPEDVATLYSWANLHGAKYRDFSASRAQTREKARQRVEQVIEEERLKVRQETEAQRAAEASRAQEEWQKFDPSVLQSPDKPGAQPTSSVQQTQNLNAPNPQPPRLDRLSALYQPTPDFGTREERTPAADPYGSPANRPPSNPISQGPM
ncbi:MAG: hypothetical protein WBL41_06530, partial [Terracidiphilus sp.]